MNIHMGIHENKNKCICMYKTHVHIVHFDLKNIVDNDNIYLLGPGLLSSNLNTHPLE